MSRFLQDVLPLSLASRPRLPDALPLSLALRPRRAHACRAPLLRDRASRGHLPCPMRYCGAILNAIEYWFTSGAERLKNTRPSIGEINVSRTLPSKVSCTSASA